MNGDEGSLDIRRQRLVNALGVAAHTGRVLLEYPQAVAESERERAFQTLVEVYEWNRQHPELAIERSGATTLAEWRAESQALART